jgi:hypothetical protein
MISLDQKYIKDSSIVSREIAGDIILVPIRRNVGDLESIFTLNETAAFAWKLIDGLMTVEEIRDQIVSVYDVTTEQAEKDILELISQLFNIGAVQRV